MLGGIAACAEDVIVEGHPPHLTLIGRKVLQREEPIHQGIIGPADRARDIVPPIVDEQVERLERFDSAGAELLEEMSRDGVEVVCSLPDRKRRVPLDWLRAAARLSVFVVLLTAC